MRIFSTSGDTASAYQSSVDALTQLVDHLSADEDSTGTSTVRVNVKLLKNELQRLATWASEHDVASGLLDHSLRESSPLKDQVIALLQDLREINALTQQYESRSTSEDSAESIDFNLKDSTALSSTSSTTHEQDHVNEAFEGPERSADSKDSHLPSQDGSTDVRTTRSFEPSEASGVARKAIDHAHKIITLLLELGPSLKNPAPHDRLERGADAIAAYIEHVEREFPKASKELQRKLGVANWDRRQSLVHLREKYTLSSQRATDAVGSFEVMVKRSSSQLELPREDDMQHRHTVSARIVAPSTASITGTQYASRFGFSDPDTQSTLLTDLMTPTEIEALAHDPSRDVKTPRSDRYQSMHVVFRGTPSELAGPNEVNKAYKHLSVQQQSIVPRPPSPNENYTGETFLCPYCFSTLEGLVDPVRWIEHVFMDLRPYMCTYHPCPRPLRTYQDRASWWAHERMVHRAKKVWECSQCHKDDRDFRYYSFQDFEKHMKNRHPISLNSQQIRAIAQFCEKEVELSEVPDDCPLCHGSVVAHFGDAAGGSNTQEDEMCSHVADHLEQLALSGTLSTRKRAEGQEVDLDFVDDSDSDEERKEEIKSLVSADENRITRDTVRARNVERYFSDQNVLGDPFNMHPSQRHKSPVTQPQLSSSRSSSTRPRASSISIGDISKVKWPLSTMRQPRNEFFTGKDDVLKEMSTLLGRRGEIYILSGLGGVGKTLTAVEFSYRYQDNFDCIFWLQADTPEGLAQSFVEINVAVGIEVNENLQKLDIEHGREWLDLTERRWLLIFDNAESWDAISTYIPYQFPTSHGSVLITTQNEDISPSTIGARLQRLDVLDVDTGAVMLLNYLKKDSADHEQRELAKEISSFVGGLPIAIAHVAGYADYSDYTLEELLEIFRDWRKVVGVATDEADDLPAAFRQAAFSYDDTLAMVYTVTLRELNRDAQDLMNILAYLNCDAVPESMIWGLHEEAELAFLDSREKMRARSIKKALLSRRLVQCKEINGQACFYVHRALQRSIRAALSMEPEKQQRVFAQAVSLLRDVYPAPSPIQQPKPEKWSEFQRLLPHVNSLREVYLTKKPMIRGSLEFARILSDAGINQWERGMTRSGLTLLRTSEEVLDALSFDSHDSLRADIHIIVALMYDNTGVSNRKEAIVRREKALEIRKTRTQTDPRPSVAALHEEEVLLYNARMDYAISLLQFHDYRRAEPVIEDCLRKYQEWGTPEELPYEYAKYYNKMALVRLYQRRYDEAIDLAKQGVKWMGVTQNFSLQSRFDFDLACILLQTGKVEESRQLHQRIFDGRVEKLGQSSELSLHSRYAIGVISEMKQQYEDAEYWFSRALSLSKSAAWSEEAVSRTKYHLARVQEAMGKQEEADAIYKDALSSLHQLTENSDEAWTGLKPGADEGIIFDHIMTICGARFTGEGLLNYVI